MPATCEQDGVEQRVCENNSEHVETRPIKATGHDYGEWTIVTPATCEQDGVERRVCANNGGHVETRPIEATGHAYGEWTVVTPATCEEDGVEQRVCANDPEHKETRRIAKLGHTDADGDGICDVCDAALVEPAPTEPESNCPCGENHTGFFAFITIFFHKIRYFFKNLFGNS